MANRHWVMTLRDAHTVQEMYVTMRDWRAAEDAGHPNRGVFKDGIWSHGYAS